MDKYDLVFDIVTHPDKYSSERLEEIFSDPETREIYALLCKINYAAESQNELTSDEVEENGKNSSAYISIIGQPSNGFPDARHR